MIYKKFDEIKSMIQMFFFFKDEIQLQRAFEYIYKG